MFLVPDENLLEEPEQHLEVRCRALLAKSGAELRDPDTEMASHEVTLRVDSIRLTVD